jgi:hypothetical protein
MMMRDNVWRYVDPTVRPLNPPVAGEPDDVALARIKTLSIIGLNCKEDVYQGIKDVLDPREAWNRLSTSFQSTNNASRLMLKDKLASLRLTEGGSVAEYLRQIQGIQAELTSMNIAAFEPEIVERIVNTLPPSYDSVYTYITGLAALPSLADISARLLQAEAQMQYRQGQTSIIKEEALVVAFRNTSLGCTPQFNNEIGRRSFDYGGPRRGSGVIGPYNFCGKEGYLMRSCHELEQEMMK